MSKETQNKWEKKILKIINPLYDPDVDTAEIRCVEEALINSIDSIVSEAFERGKEETYSGSMVYKLGARETLEEVEREIKENFNNQNSMTITYYDLLQTINKMKTNENKM